ncbi:MAG TPA: XRE family transcriptional regulator [Nitrolancea sp.]|jgi:Zn-dependent peptidase ImmA (M78 family)/transcriptional regulator with XRE-family HTH domain|nr:XRE family transcriptional regulator [Nitrolancea sp.]
MDYHRLGERLRLAREQARLSQTDAARMLGLTPAAINQYESGKRRVDVLTFERLARLYAVPLGYLFGEETEIPAWEEALHRQSEHLSAAGSAGIRQVIQKVRDLEDLYRRTGTEFPGVPHHPFSPLPDQPISKGEIAAWAERARRHYALDLAPLPELREFLEAIGFNVFSIPFGAALNDISGLFFLHPDLGPIMAINSDQNFRRRSFTLAHELAHGLFHYDRPAILCRSVDADPVERFAERFAAYFLVPGASLAEWLSDQRIAKVMTPEDVVHLARYFGISYKAMLRRLREERLLGSPEQQFADVHPDVLARALGYQVTAYEMDQQRPLPPEERLPRSFLTLAYRAIRGEQLSLRRVAELLGMSDIELEEKLNPNRSEVDLSAEPDEVYAF